MRQTSGTPIGSGTRGARRPRWATGSLALAALVLGPAGLSGQTPDAPGLRPVRGGTIRSPKRPAAAISFGPGLSYLGGQEFVLYGVARAEQHFFADLAGRRVRRLYWVQFEGYLPGVPHTYDYSEYPELRIDGRPFRVNGGVDRVPETEPRPDSDGARARAFLRGEGLEIGPEIAWWRFVWLLDDPPRHELMVIYVEDLSELGATAEGLADDAARRDSLLEAVRARGVSGMRISPLER